MWSIVESSNDAIFSTDRAGLITSWNRAAAELYGYTEAEIVGRHFSTRGAAGSRADTAHEIFRSVLRGETVKHFDTLGRRSDGAELHVAVSVSPIRAASGSIVGTSTIARNVSERVELLQCIEADRRRLAVAQASASLGSFELDLDTGQVSPIGRVPADRRHRSRATAPASTSTASIRTIATGAGSSSSRFSLVAATSECTHRIVRPDGVVRWVITRTERFCDTGSRIVAGTMLDITERHEAELALAHQATHDP